MTVTGYGIHVSVILIIPVQSVKRLAILGCCIGVLVGLIVTGYGIAVRANL